MKQYLIVRDRQTDMYRKGDRERETDRQTDRQSILDKTTSNRKTYVKWSSSADERWLLWWQFRCWPWDGNLREDLSHLLLGVHLSRHARVDALVLQVVGCVPPAKLSLLLQIVINLWKEADVTNNKILILVILDKVTN